MRNQALQQTCAHPHSSEARCCRRQHSQRCGRLPRRPARTGDSRTFCTVQKQSSPQLVRASLLPMPWCGRRLRISKAAAARAQASARVRQRRAGGRQRGSGGRPSRARTRAATRCQGAASRSGVPTCCPDCGCAPFLAWRSALCRIVAAGELAAADLKARRCRCRFGNEQPRAGELHRRGREQQERCTSRRGTALKTRAGRCRCQLVAAMARWGRAAARRRPSMGHAGTRLSRQSPPWRPHRPLLVGARGRLDVGSVRSHDHA